MSIKNELAEVISNNLGELKKTKIGGDEYKTTVDCVVKLSDKYIELEKIDAECYERTADRESNINLKVREIINEEKDIRVKNWIAIGSIIIPVVLTVWGAKKSWEFEKEGTITSIIGKGFINKLITKK